MREFEIKKTRGKKQECGNMETRVWGYKAYEGTED